MSPTEIKKVFQKLGKFSHDIDLSSLVTSMEVKIIICG